MALKGNAEGTVIMEALAAVAMNRGPATYEEAIASTNREQWLGAIREECDSIKRNKTFITPVLERTRSSTPIGFSDSTWSATLIGSKWVFKTKRNPDGTIRYKVRLVIKGYMQSDWGETYAPVGKLASFRYLASLAAGLGLSIDHMDVVTAFLNPEVDDPELFMEIPEGWNSGDVSESGTSIAAGSIVRLNKALYGLKQAPRLRSEEHTSELQSPA